jgi:outer membrane protein
MDYFILTIKNSLLLLMFLIIASPLHAIKPKDNLPPLPVFKQSTQFINALAACYTTNATLQEKVAEQKVNAENVAKAKAGWRPNLTAEGTIIRDHTERESPAPGTIRRNVSTGTLTATQNVFNGGRTVASVSAAENQVRASWAAYFDTEQSILLAAATAYLEVYSAREVYKLNLKNEMVLKKLLESVITREKLGEVTGTDVAKAESELADAITKRISAKADLTTKEGAYLNVVGFEAPETLELPALPVDLIPSSFSTLVNQSMIQNPKIISADYSARANHDNIGVHQSSLLPKVDVAGSARRSVTGQSNIPGGNGRANDYSAKATLTVPIFQGGAEWSELRRAREASTQFKITLEKTRRDTRGSNVKGWESWTSVRLRIEQIKIQIKSAETNLAGVQSEFEAGERIFIEVLDAENKLFNAKVSLETAIKDLYIAAYTLLSMVGKMTANDLKLPVEKYDIEGHYHIVKNMWFGTFNG